MCAKLQHIAGALGSRNRFCKRAVLDDDLLKALEWIAERDAIQV